MPPHQHRRNAAERAIQTWKNHFISGLSSTDPTFPLNAWDYLLPQCDITLNLLRSSRRQPHLSAHACLFGNYDFNRTPLAVPGTRVVIHDTSDQRPTFAPHGTDGYYVGPSLEHYRCFKVFLPVTQSTRDSVTVEWFPSSVPFPKVRGCHHRLQFLPLSVHLVLFFLSPGSLLLPAHRVLSLVLLHLLWPPQCFLLHQHLFGLSDAIPNVSGNLPIVLVLLLWLFTIVCLRTNIDTTLRRLQLHPLHRSPQRRPNYPRWRNF